MDRWTDADDDIPAKSRGQPKGRVATLGMAGFVKSQGSMGTENAQTFGKIEVVQSKRDQRKAETTRLMPPPPKFLTPTSADAATAAAATTPSGPPPVQFVAAAGGPPKCPVPEWAADPPSGSRLLVIKDGQVLQEIALAKVVTVFGRVDSLADVVLDHPSISRQHATAAFHPARGAWLITDLGSTHGTFVGGRQLAKHEPTELPPDTELRFAASTRRYRLPPHPQPDPPQLPQPGVAARAAASGATAGDTGAVAACAGGRGDMPPPPKRARVCFADDAEGGGNGGGSGGGGGKGGQAVTAAGGRPRQLETIIGFSDGREFVARVGPRAAAPAEGRFAAAVASTLVVSPSNNKGLSAAEAAATGATGGGRGSSGSGRGGQDGGGGTLGSPRPPGGAAARQGTAAGDGGGGGGTAAAVAVEVRPQLKDFVERIRKEPPRIGGGGSLYEQLPPPSR